MNIFIWTDPDDGIEYELMYHTGFGNEREGALWRIKGRIVWNELPPFAELPQEAMEHWHGKTILPMPTTYMTPDEVAKELNISPKTLRSWLREKYTRPEYEAGTEWRLPPNVVAAARERFQG